MKIRTHLLKKTSIIFIGVALFLAGMAHAARIKIPEERVIIGYEASSLPSSAQAGVSAGSGPDTTFSNADLARLGVVSKAYPDTIKILENILSDIRAKSPDKKINPKIQLFNSIRPEARAINSDLIVIATGFFSMLGENFPDPEMQSHALAFILAYEYAHLLYDHPAKYKEKLEQTNITDDIASGYQMLKQIQVTHNQLGGKNNQAFQKAEVGFMGATVASPWIEAELYRAAYAPYVKKEEQLADFMATDLLLDVATPDTKFDAKTGASPIRAIYKSYDSSAKGKIKAIAKDVEKTMRTETKNMVAAAPAQVLNGQTNFGEQFKNRLKLTGASYAWKQVKGRLDRKNVHLYYSARDRVNAIDTYADLHYPPREEKATDSDLAMFGIASVFEAEHSPGSAAQQAMTFLAQGDVDGAAKALASVSEKKRFDNIQFLVATADVAFAKGDLPAAIKYYRQAIRRIDAPLRAFSSLSKAHMRAGNDDKAIEALDIGVKRFSEREFIVQRIGALAALGRKTAALEALAKCQAHGNEALSAKCDLAAEPAKPRTEKTEKKGPFDFGITDAIGGVIEDVVD